MSLGKAVFGGMEARGLWRRRSERTKRGALSALHIAVGVLYLALAARNALGGPAGQFAFSSSSYSVSEAGASVTISIIRTGTISGTASVDFSTQDGTAVAGLDYLATAGTALFGVGETNKTFNVAILENCIPQSNRVFGVILTNPSPSAVIGTPGNATITIVDDDFPDCISVTANCALDTNRHQRVSGSVLNCGSNTLFGVSVKVLPSGATVNLGTLSAGASVPYSVQVSLIPCLVSSNFVVATATDACGASVGDIASASCLEARISCIDVTADCTLGESNQQSIAGSVVNCGSNTLLNVTVTASPSGATVSLGNLGVGASVPYALEVGPGSPCAPSNNFVIATATNVCGGAASNTAPVICPGAGTSCINVTATCGQGTNNQLSVSGSVVNCASNALLNVTVTVFPSGTTINMGDIGAGATIPYTTSVLGGFPCGPSPIFVVAIGTNSCGATASNNMTAFCPPTQAPGIAVKKYCPTNPPPPGGLLTYSGAVINTGNTTLSNVTVMDDQPAPCCPTLVLGPITLPAGGFAGFSGSYFAPTNGCSTTNTLTASGISQCGMIVTNSVTSTCPLACQTNPPPTDGCSPGLIACGSNPPVVVNATVSVDFNTSPPTYVGDPALQPYFTYDTSGPTADTWKAIFNTDGRKLIVSSGVTITTVAVPLTGNNRRAPGIEIDACELEVQTSATIAVCSLNQPAGDILLKILGNVTIDGVVSNSVTGTMGVPGDITIDSHCQNIYTGPGSRVVTYGQDYGGSDITLTACNGSITINGLVDASYNGIRASAIKVTASSDVTIDGRNYFGTEVVAGTLRNVTSGVSVRSRRDPLPGSIFLQAGNNIMVYGNRLVSKLYPNYGAVAVKTASNSSKGGLIDARAIRGDIIATDRSFDDENRFNQSAVINLQAGYRIDLSVSGTINDGATNNAKAIVSTEAGDTGQGGTNILRAFNAGISIAPSAKVLADFTGRPGANGANLFTSCSNVINSGSVIPAAALSVACGSIPTALLPECSCSRPPVITCASNKTVQCGTDWTFDAPSAIDPCTGSNLTVTVLGDVVTGSCPQSITRTWLAVNQAGSNSCSQTITLVDDVPPVLVCASNKVVFCDPNWEFDVPTAFDACSGTNVTIQRISTVSTNVGCDRIFTATWEATDYCSNVSRCSQSVLLIDGIAPKITACPPNITVQCLSQVPPCTSNVQDFFQAGGTLNEVCLSNLLYGCSDSPLQGTLCNGRITRKYAFTNCYGNFSICAQQITISNTLPAVICAHDKTVCDTNFTFDPPVPNSCCGTNVSIRVVGTTVTNLFCQQLWTQTWEVTDCCSNVARCSQTVTVTLPPNIICSPNKAVCGTNFTFDPPVPANSCCASNLTIVEIGTVTTNLICGQVQTRTWAVIDCCSRTNFCSQQVTITQPSQILCAPEKRVCGTNFTFDPPQVLGGCCSNAPKVLSTTITNLGCAQLYTRTWLVVDCCGNTNVCAQRVTVTQAPIVACAPSRTVPCGSEWSFDRPTVISNSACCTNVSFILFSNDLVSSNSCQNVYRGVWQMLDCCTNLTFVCTQFVTVPSGIPPQIACATNKTVTCTDSWRFDKPTVISASGACCTNVAFALVSSNLVLASQCQSVYRGVWNMIDCCSNVTPVCTQLVTVVSIPQIACPSDKTVPCTNGWSFDQPTIMTNNGACCTNVTFRLFSSDLVSSNQCENVYQGIWQMIDCCTNQHFVCTQLVTVPSGVPPQIVCATNKTVTCGSKWRFDPPTVVSASGACCTNATFGLVSSNVVSSGPCQSVYSGVWQMTDCCASVSTVCTQLVTVTATPAIACAPDKTVPCTGGWSFDQPTIITNNSVCCTNVTFVLFSSNLVSISQCESVYRGVWRMINCCTNFSFVCTQLVTVPSGVPPQIVCATNKTVPCDSIWNFDKPTVVSASGACCTNATFGLLSSNLVSSVPCQSIYRGVWAMTDCCANVRQVCTQLVAVVADTSGTPSITCATNKTVPCGTNWTFNEPTITSSCTANIQVSVNTVTNVAGTNGCGSVVTRTWTVTDLCSSNSATCSQTVTVGAGTQPLSAVTILTPSLIDNGMVLQWQGLPGMLHTVEYRDVTSSKWTSLPKAVDMPYTDGFMSVTDTLSSVQARFYRVVTKPE